MVRNDLAHVLLRRWYLVLAGLVITVGLVSTTYSIAPISYTTEADILLVPPKANAADNPLLGLAGLADVPTAISRSVFNDRTVRELANEGVTGGYSVSPDASTSAPLVVATSTGSTAAAALRGLNALVKIIPLTLDRLQQAQRVPARSYITVQKLHVDTKAAAVTRTRTRLLLVAAVFGIALTMFETVFADRFLVAQRDAKESPRRQSTKRKPRESRRGQEPTPSAGTENNNKSVTNPRPGRRNSNLRRAGR